MTSIRSSLNAVIDEARCSGAPPGRRGHVYLAGWRLNPLRDLSSSHRAGGAAKWASGAAAASDDTLVGLLYRALEAGVVLRLLVWFPQRLQSLAGPGREIACEHFYLARLIERKSADLERHGYPAALGVVALDGRVAGFAGSRHEKLAVLRGAGATNVAYCGGIDLAFSRRDDASGDWQSGEALPGGRAPAFRSGVWPHASDVDYPCVDRRDVTRSAVIAPDLPVDVYGRFGQRWHDHHLRVAGDIVVTLERHFVRRWLGRGSGDVVRVLRKRPIVNVRSNVVYVTDRASIAVSGSLEPLPEPRDVPADAERGRIVTQVWCTMPSRGDRETAEYSMLAGIARACATATELIFVVDQYFWSVPLARLLRRRLSAPSAAELHVIVILPAFPDAHARSTLSLRRLALRRLLEGLAPEWSARVRVFNLWDRERERGIYVHAKSQAYDQSLLVCGSANLNTRSLLNDVELGVAVFDRDVVRDYHAELWRFLFSRSPGYSETFGASFSLNDPGSGRIFFERFLERADATSLLVEDPDAFGHRAPGVEPALPPRFPARPQTRATERPSFVHTMIFDPAPRSLRRFGDRLADADLEELSRLIAE